jgi:hypothetical protein
MDRRVPMRAVAEEILAGTLTAGEAPQTAPEETATGRNSATPVAEGTAADGAPPA